ncbi:histidine triad (HIT) family protein [Rhizobiales bacterium GAS113]|nr:histidine triad (HIT) family protein [Rhizobiales bacterium GAS113]SEE31921.1 histidine triad (HIT) family protein [Rhizobiales bacterium GAS188]
MSASSNYDPSNYDQSNIFAKILRGEVPSHKVHEDEHSFAFMDIMPRTPGHTLVIPKVAARNILDVPQDALSHTILTVQRVARAAKLAFQADGITLTQFSEAAGGQVVFHLHFHVLPRYDRVALQAPHTNMEANETLAANAAKLRAALAELSA